MKIEPVCYNCKKPLFVKSSHYQGHDDTLVMDVVPCGNLDCRDCSDCDDNARVADLQRRFDVMVNNNAKLRETIENVKQQLKEKAEGKS